MTTIDYGYAANLEELQDVIENLTNVALGEHNARYGDTHFDPATVKLGNMQVRVTLDADIPPGEDTTVFNIRFAFLSEGEARAEQR